MSGINSPAGSGSGGGATEATLSSIENLVAEDTDAGFFSNVWILLQRIYDAIRAPEFMTVVAGGKKIQAITTADSAIGTVTTLTTAATLTNLTNFNTIDSREMIWGMWNDVYYNGIRSKIT